MARFHLLRQFANGLGMPTGIYDSKTGYYLRTDEAIVSALKTVTDKEDRAELIHLSRKFGYEPIKKDV